MVIWQRLIDLVRMTWWHLQQGTLPSLGYWVYPLVALLAAIEGPFTTLLAAAASSVGLARPELVFVSAATGNLASDTLWYTLGRAGRLEWITRGGRRFGLHPRHVNDLSHRMQQHAPRVLFVAKLTGGGLIVPALVVAGLSRVRWRRWLLPLVAAEMIWTGSLVLIGYYAAGAIRHIDSAPQYLGLAAVGALILVGLRWLRRWLDPETQRVSVADQDAE